MFNSLKRIKISNFSRYYSTFNIGNFSESIMERNDYPLEKCKKILKDKTVSVIGYGPQGKCQALNLRDNGIDVILGVREDGNSYEEAKKDGWLYGINLFNIEQAVEQSDIVKYLLSDIGQIKQWNSIYPYLTEDKTLYFSHGFGITFNDQTNIKPPKNIDVIMVAPKGAGMTVRDKFLEGKGINVSYAIHQDFTGKAKDTCLALAFSIGCGHAFETTFEKEVYSDLVGERCVLMGMIQGAFCAQYDILRKRGHSPVEAYNETVEEALVSLWPLVNDKGMDWLYRNCSTTAQRGALDWAPIFEKALKPIIDECYRKVSDGSEVKKLIEINEDVYYNEKLSKELDDINKHELWTVAKQMRKLRQ
jgi:ketol-acid reductoisomerase